MFVRSKSRWKDGVYHRHWSIVENARVGGGRVVQRQVRYLGEISDTRKVQVCYGLIDPGSKWRLYRR